VRDERGASLLRLRFVTLAIVVVLALPGTVAGTSGAAGRVTGRVVASPLGVTLQLALESVRVGQLVKAEARITNVGAVTLRGIAVEIRADRAGLAIRTPTVEVASLKPGRSTTVTWSVCGRVEGSYVLLARVTHDVVQLESEARLLSVTAGGRRACP
jgi:hypothetical protein